MNTDTILSIVRHLITSAGAVLVTKGIADSGTIEAVGGGVVAIIGWFIGRKRQQQ